MSCGVVHVCKAQRLQLTPSSLLPQSRAGAKGFGLFTSEDLKAGQFIIEYIGEVQTLLLLFVL